MLDPTITRQLMLPNPTRPPPGSRHSGQAGEPHVWIGMRALRGDPSAEAAFLPVQILHQAVFWHAYVTRSVPRWAPVSAAIASERSSPLTKLAAAPPPVDNFAAGQREASSGEHFVRNRAQHPDEDEQDEARPIAARRTGYQQSYHRSPTRRALQL